MKAGPRRHRIEIQHPVKQTADTGDVTFDWPHFAWRWAQVSQLNSDEVLNAAQMGLEITHTVKCPWVSGFTSDMRLVLNGNRILEPQSVNNVDERNITHEFLCRESE